MREKSKRDPAATVLKARKTYPIIAACERAEEGSVLREVARELTKTRDVAVAKIMLTNWRQRRAISRNGVLCLMRLAERLGVDYDARMFVNVPDEPDA